MIFTLNIKVIDLIKLVEVKTISIITSFLSSYYIFIKGYFVKVLYIL